MGTTLRQVRRLQQSRRARDESGLHFIEGVRNFVRCVDWGVEFETLIVSRRLLRSVVAQKLVRRLRAGGTSCVAVSPEQFRGFAMLERASGIAAIVRAHWSNLDEVPVDRDSCWLAVERIRSAGNLGTLLRTAQAARAGGVIFTDPLVDPFAPAVVRASMGALFTLRLARAEASRFEAWLRRHEFAVVGACPRAPAYYDQVSYQSPSMLLVGEERHGMSPAQRRICTTTVRIPMAPQCDSLNVAVAGSLLLYQITRQLLR